MKVVPKRMRQASETAAGRGGFFTEKTKKKQTEFLPQYMNVANDIIKRIFDGEYRPGAKLPSMRDLARKYGVSVQVVLSAFQGMQALHYIETRPKQGVYVSQDIRPARFYRIGVFITRQNPFAYGCVLYHLHACISQAGYNMIVGTDYDGGLSLKQWVSHKHNLDALVLLGTPREKDLERFKRIKIPYVFLAAKPNPKVDETKQPFLKTFTDWFLNTYIDQPATIRPAFLFDRSAESQDWTLYSNAMEYQPEEIYGYGKAPDGNLCVIRKKDA